MAQFYFSAFADEAADDLEGQIAALKRNGIGYIEPRFVDKKGILALTEEELLEMKKKLDAAGIKVGSLGSPIGKYPIEEPFEIHLEDFKKALRAAKLLGTDKIRMFSFFHKDTSLADCRQEVIKRLKVLVEMAKAEGITLCHENESHIYGELPREVKDLLENVPGLGGIFDPANYVMAGADAFEGACITLPYLSYVHIKDAVCESQTIVPAGEGEGRILDVLNMIDAQTDAPVMMTLEPHLNEFTAFKSIDTHELKGKYSFKNNTESFDFAVAALEKLLSEGGYKKENGKWSK
ncbi:MAG: sugar phosphate isomerase/epimerase [Clostridia bacterium]|nr:sugar phosphate isomerase/epimerase [Clostridia bacterium]